MKDTDLHLVRSGPMPYLLSIPDEANSAFGVVPLLCFLHGYDEGAPTPVEQALTKHGPLADTASPRARSAFIVVAPQMPVRGDLWYRYADVVLQIVAEVKAAHGADPRRLFLTGFSFGGNGVFDLALLQKDFWAALWPVDPTRVPPADPNRPVWLSSGQISRFNARAYQQRLQLESLTSEPPGERIYVDQGQDHVGTATHAYRDDRIYDWLLTKQRASAGV